MPIDKISVNANTPLPRRTQSGSGDSIKTGTSGGTSSLNQVVPLTKGGVVSIPQAYKKAQYAGGMGMGMNTLMASPQIFSPLHTPQQWQIATKRREQYQWCRHWYENEPKVAAAIDFYSQFPMNGFTLECGKSAIRKYYEHLGRKLQLNKWLKYISHEYYLIGDVFPFMSIDCPVCGGAGQDRRGYNCAHKGGTFKRMILQNPDFIEIQKNPLDEKSQIFMLPDDQLRMIVEKQIEPMYSQLSSYIKESVISNQPIQLSSRTTSHISHNKAPYGMYGSPLMRRLFTTLAYKTKLQTANWMTAERLILPIRLVKVGSEQRPADADDIADMQANLAALAQDPNLTIVTHHAVDIDYIGATGRIHQINQELELVGKEILDGFMLNQALLNGEMGHYSSAQVGVEAILHRLDSWRNSLSDWVYDHVFIPIAKMKNFVDQGSTEDMRSILDDDEYIEYLHPTIKWNDMQLRDNSQQMQIFIQLNQEQKISNDTLLKKLDLNWDEEVEKMRDEQVQVGAGNVMQDQGGMGGGGGGMPPGGGAAPGMPDMGGGMDPSGGMGGGDMGGGMGGPPGGAMAGAAPARITKRGKGSKPDENQEQPVMSSVPMTKLEAKVVRAMQQLELPFQVAIDYRHQVPGVSQPYQMDVAIPSLKVDIEADGKIWHEEDADNDDAQRDQKLASEGWRVLRFREDAIKENIDGVKDMIYSQVYEAAQEKQERNKTASVGEDAVPGYFRVTDDDNGEDLGVVIANV
jgi:very-short-patch-repair endonuclease